MRTLRTARNLPDQAAHLAFVRRHAVALAAQRGDTLAPEAVHPPDDVAAAARPAVAHANHGDWVADCPSGCGGAEVVEPGWPFFCCRCANVALGGRWRPVTWPEDRAAIEAELDARLIDAYRHWTPGESLDDLRRDTASLLAELREGA